MIKRLAVLAFAMLCASPLAAHAQRTSMQCAPTNAEKATVAEIAAKPEAWLGRCVTVDAVYGDERLYPDLATAKAGKTSIGGYVDGHGYLEGFWKTAFTGRVSDCAKAQDDLDTGLLRSPGISLMGRVLGCLTGEGPFLLFMSQGKLEKAG